MKLDFNFDGKTLLKKWWQQVKSNFQTVQDEYNTLEDNLSEEINQRVNLGNDLTDKITKETSDRKRADSSIESKISTEISDRKESDSSLEIKISDEVNSRQEADDELSGRIEYEKMERQSDNEENKSRFFEKADKTELYGREKNITHKITHSLKKSDFIININAGNGNGTVTINSLPVQTKIFRDGRAYIQTAPISASFSAEKGEEGVTMPSSSQAGTPTISSPMAVRIPTAELTSSWPRRYPAISRRISRRAVSSFLRCCSGIKSDS